MHRIVLLATLALPAAAHAQAKPVPATLDPLVVTATRRAERSFDVPASIDTIDGSAIRYGQPAISISALRFRYIG